MKYNNITVVYPEGMEEEHIKYYVDTVLERNKDKAIQSIELKVDGEFIDAKWSTNPIDFQRIRRITGYLVGTLERLKNKKKAEENQRVKHNLI